MALRVSFCETSSPQANRSYVVFLVGSLVTLDMTGEVAMTVLEEVVGNIKAFLYEVYNMAAKLINDIVAKAIAIARQHTDLIGQTLLVKLSGYLVKIKL
jgi:hypothetical protein